MPGRRPALDQCLRLQLRNRDAGMGCHWHMPLDMPLAYAAAGYAAAAEPATPATAATRVALGIAGEWAGVCRATTRRCSRR